MIKLIFLLRALLMSFVITFAIIPFVIALARKYNIMDQPDGKLKLHGHSTPYLGGIAIYLGFSLTLLLTCPLDYRFSIFLLGNTFLLCLGLLDDLIMLKPYEKFIGQIIGALCLVKITNSVCYTDSLAKLLWIVTVINAFNLVDVMDGLATTLAITASCCFLLCIFIVKAYSMVLVIGSFLGALLAFWFYNKPKATIYLGDAGSLLIGGILASTLCMFPWSSCTMYGYSIPIVILAIPLLEIVSLIIIRTLKGIPFYKGSPDHFCLYLRDRGWSVYGILGYSVVLSLAFFSVVLLSLFNIFALTLSLSVLVALIAIWYRITLGKGFYKKLRSFKT